MRKFYNIFEKLPYKGIFEFSNPMSFFLIDQKYDLGPTFGTFWRNLVGLPHNSRISLISLASGAKNQILQIKLIFHKKLST